jgi:replicative DNA helicase
LENLEVALISKILETKEIYKALNANAGLCIKMYPDLWEYIVGYNSRFKQVPTLSIIKQKFQEFEPESVEDVSLEYLIDEIQSEHIKELAEDIIIDTAGMLKNEEPRDALLYAFSKLSTIVHETQSTKDVDLAADVGIRVNSLKERIEKTKEGKEILGIPSSIPAIDYIFGGWQEGDFISIMGWTESAKSIPVKTLLPTPNGWCRMDELKVGDYVIGRNGKPTKVLGIFPQGIRPAYQINFSDGSNIICDEQHLWTIETAKQRQRRLAGKSESFTTLTTKQMVDSGLRYKERESHEAGYKYYLPYIEAVEYNKVDLPIDSYTLGTLLGNGHLGDQTSLTSNQLFIHEKVRKNNPQRQIYFKPKHGNMTAGRSCFRVDMRNDLESLGLRGKRSREKFIPSQYLIAHIEARLELLYGLMDTGGQPAKNQKASYSTYSQQLADNVVELVRSLGGIAKRHDWKKHCGFKVVIWTPFNPFTIPFKYHKHKDSYGWFRAIESIEKVPEEDCEMACLLVDTDDHLFIIDNYIPTHNTWLAIFFAVQAWLRGFVPLVFSLELDDKQYGYRADTLMGAGKFSNTSLMNARGIDVDIYENWTDTQFKNKHPFYLATNDSIDEVNQFTIQSKIEQYNPDIVFIDYHSLVDDARRGKTETEKHKNLSRDFKKIAGRYGIPIIDIVSVTMQEGHNERVAELHEVAWSKAIAYDSDLALSVRKEGQIQTVECKKNRRGPYFAFKLYWDFDQGIVTVQDWEE